MTLLPTLHEILSGLASLGAAAQSTVWLPVGLWTLVALGAEAGLRVGRAGFAVGLAVRGALMTVLPAMLLAAPLLADAVPSLRPSPEVTPIVAGPLLPAAWDEAPVAAPVRIARPDPVAVGWGLGTLGAALSGLAALLALGVAARRIGATRRLPRASRDVQTQAARTAGRLGLRPPDIRRTGPDGVPFTVGWRRPLVVVPDGLDGADLALVLAHELAHVARADFARHAVERGIRAAFVWHPLVHILGARLAVDRERAADAAVIAGYPGRGGAYARLLVRFTEGAAPVLALGAVRRTSHLRQRLDAMTCPAPVRPRLARLAGLLVLVLPLWLTAATVPDPLPASDGFSWSLDRLTIDGEPRAVTDGFTTLHAETFSNLTLVAEPLGVLTIADRPFPGAIAAGSFDGRRLDVSVDGHRIEITSQTPYFAASRPAYARLIVPVEPPATRRAMFVVDTGLEAVPAGPRPSLEVFGVFELVALTQAAASDPNAPRITVEGRVVDVVTGEGIPGASLAALALQPDGGARSLPAGAATGPDGRFSVTVPDETNGLRVSRAGYAVRIVRLDGQTSGLVVELTPVGAVRGPDAGAASSGAPMPEVFDVVEDPPVLIGGLEGLQARLPAGFDTGGASGTVTVQLVVDETGRPTDLEILRSPSAEMSEMALAAVEASSFRPGRQRGRAVKVRYRLPVRFE